MLEARWKTLKSSNLKKIIRKKTRKARKMRKMRKTRKQRGGQLTGYGGTVTGKILEGDYDTPDSVNVTRSLQSGGDENENDDNNALT
uniref:Uncharacterized protein n=1 Tax=viral metagenome TaxID=1070528 RepID=A0A6C0K0I5_9ZZZZ